MSDPAKDDRDDALLRRLYDEPGAGDDDLAERGARDELASLRRVRGAFHEYARATEVEPPSRGVDELLAVARARASARPAVAEERPGLWARLRAWFAPILAHPALASAAMVVVVAGIAGILYLKGKASVVEPEVRGTGAVATPATGATPTEARDRDLTEKSQQETSVVARLEDETVPGPAPATHSGPPAHDKKLPRPAPDKGKGTALAGSGQAEVTGGAATDDYQHEGLKTGNTADPSQIGVGDGVITTEAGERPGSVAPTMPQTPPAPPPAPVTKDRPPTKKPVEVKPSPEPARPGPDATDAPDVGGDKSDGKVGGGDLGQQTRQARTAARAGDCAVVKAIGGRVRAANTTYYKQVFAADTEIKKCL